ncbi:MAG: IS256 family transposase [Candidatus Zambryskibacteria bacterium]|nr:IS256 family transposase [Candidatus Zambryskibacteria bacterium]
MSKYTIESTPESRPFWEGLEAFARREVQSFIQRILEEEVTEHLGRGRSQRREAVDSREGYRNGYGKPRNLSTSLGTIRVRRPRVRGLMENFESRILPLFKRRTEEVGKLLPELYLHGLSLGDFDLAMRGLLGEGAPLSEGSIVRLKVGWRSEYDVWKRRSLEGLDALYLWVDGIYVKAGLEKDKAALLVVIAALKDGSKAVLAVESGHRESVESWSGILRDLKRRGLKAPRLVVGDGHLGIWGALSNVFPDTAEQRCWNHRIINILDKISKKKQPEAKSLLTAIPYAPTRDEVGQRKKAFQKWCGSNGCTAAGDLLDRDWERMVTFYGFPKEHWKHLRTTNPVESPFATVRLRTGAAKRFKKVENATAMIWKVLMVAEKTFRKIAAPELLAEVAEGTVYVNGVKVKNAEPKVAA